MSQVNKIDEILNEFLVYGEPTIPHAKQALLSAILEVMPKNELNVASDFKNSVLIEGENIGREQCRQAIKELFNGVEG